MTLTFNFYTCTRENNSLQVLLVDYKPPLTLLRWNLIRAAHSFTARTPVSPAVSAGERCASMEAPTDRQKGWYLSLMAPNTKGPKFAWLDPSRLYCNSQV